MNAECRKLKSGARFLILLLFLILHSTFLIPKLARAQESPLPPLNQFCFTADECKGDPYHGTLSGEAQECLGKDQDQRYIDAGYKYYCYAPSKPYTLQIPLLGRTVSSLEDYISRVFKWLVGIVGVVAGIMIVWAGVKWLTAAGSPDRISNAKQKIADAAVGLILVLSSYFILQTINPALVRLQLPPVKLVRQETIGEGSCINRSDFLCAETYTCDAAEYIGNPPCPGGIHPGTCLGQFCGGGGVNGCLPVLKDKIVNTSFTAGGGGETAPYAASLWQHFSNIIDKKFCLPRQCPGDCTTITDMRICASPACNCIVTVEGRESIVCRSKVADGQPCTANAQCQSGSCNFAEAPNVCAGALTQGEHRPNGTECALDQPGFCGQGSRCIDSAGTDGNCSDGTTGALCGTTRDCAQGLRCHNCAYPEQNKCGPAGDESPCSSGRPLQCSTAGTDCYDD